MQKSSVLSDHLIYNVLKHYYGIFAQWHKKLSPLALILCLARHSVKVLMAYAVQINVLLMHKSRHNNEIKKKSLEGKLHEFLLSSSNVCCSWCIKTLLLIVVGMWTMFPSCLPFPSTSVLCLFVCSFFVHWRALINSFELLHHVQTSIRTQWDVFECSETHSSLLWDCLMIHLFDVALRLPSASKKSVGTVIGD